MNQSFALLYLFLIYINKYNLKLVFYVNYIDVKEKRSYNWKYEH